MIRSPIALVPLCLPLGVAMAQGTSPPDVAMLLERLEKQERRLQALEEKLTLQETMAKAAISEVPVVTATPTRLSFASADGANAIRFRGLLHFDGRLFADDVTAENSDTWLLRRVRPVIEGTLHGDYDFRFTPDFGGGRTTIVDAYAVARLRPWAAVTVGKFKVPVGLERLVSGADLRFVERAFPTSLVPNRDLGVLLSGDVAQGALTYSLGYFNGVSDGGSSDGNTPTADAESDMKGDWAARVFVRPFAESPRLGLQGLGFGIAGTHVDSTGDTTSTLLPSYRTPGQQVFFNYRGNTVATASTPAARNATYADGERFRWTPQFYYSFGPFGLLGEYVNVTQAVTRINESRVRSESLDHGAWQLQFSWFLTGEDETFSGFDPKTTFSVGRAGWGAFELVGRYHELSIDVDTFSEGADSFADPDTSARKARAWGVGLNWYLNQNLKGSLNYERTRFDGGAPAGADRKAEEVLLTRAALVF